MTANIIVDFQSRQCKLKKHNDCIGKWDGQSFEIYCSCNCHVERRKKLEVTQNSATNSTKKIQQHPIEVQQGTQHTQLSKQMDSFEAELMLLDDDYMMSSPFRICKECGIDHSFRPNFDSTKKTIDIILELIRKTTATSKLIREQVD